MPLRFFLTAPWLGAGAGLVVAVGGDLSLASRWTPTTLAATHALAIGFLAFVMVGAVLQVLPVVAGAPVPGADLLSRWLHAPLLVGTLSLVAGFLGFGPWSFRAAVVLLGASLSIFVVAFVTALWRAPPAQATVRGVATAVMSLAAVAGLGLVLAAGWGWAPTWPLLRLELTSLHLAWGTLGWVSCLVIAMAYQVVPMFQLTPEYPVWMQRTFVPVLAMSLLVLSLSPLHDTTLLWGGALSATTLVAFSVRTLVQQAHRRRRIPDATVAFWRLGMTALLASALVWPWTLGPTSDPRLTMMTGALFFVGFATSVVTGMLYKIVPFLCWLHLQNQLLASVDRRGYRLPTLRDFISERLSRIQLRLHVASLLALSVAIVSTTPHTTRAAGVTLASSFALLGAGLISAGRRYGREAAAITRLAAPNSEVVAEP